MAATVELLPLPRTLPRTQSFFYMPLLTNAYLKNLNKEIPEGLKKEIESIKQLTLLTSERYERMLEGVTNKLKKYPDIMELMNKSYKNIDNKGDKHSREPTEDSGHITGRIQEFILENSYVGKDLEDFKDGFPKTRKIKELFDHIIIMNYLGSKYFLKYLKYKQKYINLKKNKHVN